MAVGDDAAAQGYPLVPGTGEEGRVRWGAREINRTRDFVAQARTWVNTRIVEVQNWTNGRIAEVQNWVDAHNWDITHVYVGGNPLYTNRAANMEFRRAVTAITYGTGNPSGGQDGDIYFKIL